MTNVSIKYIWAGVKRTLSIVACIFGLIYKQKRNEGNNTLDNKISDSQYSQYKYIEEWFMLFNTIMSCSEKEYHGPIKDDHFHNE